MYGISVSKFNVYVTCGMAFFVPMHRNILNITYLLTYSYFQEIDGGKALTGNLDMILVWKSL